MSEHVPALPLDLDPLIAEAKQRARRRRLLLAACLLAAAAAASSAAVALRSSARPLAPAVAPPTCHSAQLRLALTSGGVAGGTVGDAFTFANTSNAVCMLSGWPRVRLMSRNGRLVTLQPHDLIASGYSLKHPPPIPRVRLAPGGTVQWLLMAEDSPRPGHGCSTAQKLLVVPPGEDKAIAVVATVPFCGPRYFWTFPIGRLH